MNDTLTKLRRLQTIVGTRWTAGGQRRDVAMPTKPKYRCLEDTEVERRVDEFLEQREGKRG